MRWTWRRSRSEQAPRPRRVRSSMNREWLAKQRGYELVVRADAALEAGEIDEAGGYREVAAVITPAYLAADNPRAQSGHSGDDVHWERARSLIAYAIDRDGTFLDV